MTTVTYRFLPIRRSRSIRLKCDGCGKWRSRSITVEHTVNPYNKNGEGSIRTPAEVLACVLKELDDACESVRRKGIICNVCASLGRTGKDNAPAS